MITRIFHVTDAITSEYFLVTLFEEVDLPVCQHMGISPGFKIINRISGRVVESCAGYRFDPESYCESMIEQSRKFIQDGTADTFGLLLSEIENIRKLPDTIDVEQIREFWIKVSRSKLVSSSIIETISECGSDSLVKCLYSGGRMHHIALIDSSQNKVVYDMSTTSTELEYILPEYLWIPVREGDIEYLNKIDIYPFQKRFIKPEQI